MFWCIRKPFSSVRLASCKSFVGVLRFSFFFASFAVHAQVLAAPAPSCASPAALNVASAYSDGGFAYLIPGSYGTADKVGSYTRSILRVFENGREIGPAHSWHADIRSLGRGRFSHWSSSNGGESVRFAASDNTDVRRNGKRYSYCRGSGTPSVAEAGSSR
jgi:pectate lyase